MTKSSFSRAVSKNLAKLPGVETVKITADDILFAFQGDEERLQELWSKYKYKKIEAQSHLELSKSFLIAAFVTSAVTGTVYRPMPSPGFNGVFLALLGCILLSAAFAGGAIHQYLKYKTLKNKPPEELDAELKAILTEIMDEFEEHGLIGGDLDHILHPRSNITPHPELYK